MRAFGDAVPIFVGKDTASTEGISGHVCLSPLVSLLVFPHGLVCRASVSQVFKDHFS